MGHIGMFEYETLCRKSIQIGRLDPEVSITSHGIEPQLIGQNEEQIGLGLHI